MINFYTYLARQQFYQWIEQKTSLLIIKGDIYDQFERPNFNWIRARFISKMAIIHFNFSLFKQYLACNAYIPSFYDSEWFKSTYPHPLLSICVSLVFSLTPWFTRKCGSTHRSTQHTENRRKLKIYPEKKAKIVTFSNTTRNYEYVCPLLL